MAAPDLIFAQSSPRNRHCVFAERDEITRSLQASGFRIDEVRDAPDRPGREFVFIASVSCGA
jgi:hypothetical protein